jgi:phenylalanine-4-hydroxylase
MRLRRGPINVMGGSAARQRRGPASERVRRHRAPEAGSLLGGETISTYSAPQRHEDYTPAEHETWRLLLARSEALVNRYERRLHPAYVEGFRSLVLPWTAIPRLDEIDAALAPHGWKTLCVNGYIPPEVYAGLLAGGTFPIAREIRRRQHLEFSPTPDLAHDMLGHIPMLVCAEHRQFLRRISSATGSTPPNRLDHELFVANRELGALRCAGRPRPRALRAAQARVDAAHTALVAAPSALAQLDRLYLWSVEFGLMGTPDEFSAYGAGLLSSPAEAEALFTRAAPVFDFSSAVTRRAIIFSDYQSAYFVARDFRQLNDVLTDVQSARSDGA